MDTSEFNATPSKCDEPKRGATSGDLSPFMRLPQSTAFELLQCVAGDIVHVVVDFGARVCLTDLYVPANAAFSAIAIDEWDMEKRAALEQRLAFSTEIENRSLVVTDTSKLVRALRITFTMREIKNAATTFQLGAFYGTRFFSPWQIYASDGQWAASQYWDMQHDINVERFPFVDPCASALLSTLTKVSKVAEKKKKVKL